jgi:MATE family multidrug resistance protein|tara:strand:+ start:1668 stop:3275 length:1608 start_codon:yes stop_codon:yes gene_type:complete
MTPLTARTPTLAPARRLHAPCARVSSRRVRHEANCPGRRVRARHVAPRASIAVSIAARARTRACASIVDDSEAPAARASDGDPWSVARVVGVPSERVTAVLDQALPVMGGMASQNVLNLADAAMVGRLGTASVAAVGLGSTMNFQCQAALQGVASGVQAMAARRMGEGRYDEVARPLNAALILVCLMGVPLAILAFVYADALVPLYTTDASVVANAVPYLRARVLAVPAVGINFAFRGFWNAIQQPQVYMNTLIVMHTVNFTLSLILTFVGVPQLGVPPLGALGAGLGTSFSIWCGTAMYMYQGMKRATKLGFLQKRPTMADLRVLATQALPTSVTNLLYASGMMTLYSIVGRLGTTEVAAVNVLINLMLFLILPCMGMGLAAGALSGRALGRGDVEDAKQWPWDVAKITALLMSVVGFGLAMCPRVVLGVFLTDPHAVDIAVTPLRMTGLTVCGDAVSLTMQNALLGVGDAKRVALVSILSQWALFLPSAYLAVAVFDQNLTVVWTLYVAYRFIQGLVYANIWRGGAWAKIKLA